MISHNLREIFWHYSLSNLNIKIRLFNNLLFKQTITDNPRLVKIDFLIIKKQRKSITEKAQTGKTEKPRLIKIDFLIIENKEIYSIENKNVNEIC